MESELKRKIACRAGRAKKVRNRVRGSQSKPRLCVVKTNKHLHVQLIDDVEGKTLASTSTCGKDFQKTEFAKKNAASAKQLGLKIAQLAAGLKINSAIFDRGASKYHGVVAALADGAREGGLKI